MNRILIAATGVCLVVLPNIQARPASVAATSTTAGDAADPDGLDSDAGGVASMSDSSSTDPQFGTASAEADVDGPFLSAFGFAASFQDAPWKAESVASWSDELRFRFPVASLQVEPSALQVETTALFTWSIAGNGNYILLLQDESAGYATATGIQFDSFGNVPDQPQGSAVVVATVALDGLALDSLDSSMYIGEISLSMLLTGGASSGVHEHGNWEVASGGFTLEFSSLKLLGIAGSPSIESDSGLSYTIETTADFDDDGDVDGRDFLIWQRGFGMAGADRGNGDANGDGNVDGDDLSVWQSQYGEPGHLVAVTGIPEPATITIAAVALVVGISCRKRRG